MLPDSVVVFWRILITYKLQGYVVNYLEHLQELEHQVSYLITSNSLMIFLEAVMGCVLDYFTGVTQHSILSAALSCVPDADLERVFGGLLLHQFPDFSIMWFLCVLTRL